MAPTPLTRSGPEDGGNYEFHWSGGYLTVHLLSDVGKKRSRNEDSCMMCVPEDAQAFQARGGLFAVADGMGGASGGQYASKLAMQTLADEYYGQATGGTPQLLRTAVEEANRRIFEASESNPEYRGMGTTVSALLCQGDCGYVAQVGDSRVYLAREGNPLLQVTHDHSLVAEQVRNGYISEEEARTHALKNLITRAVGTKDNVKVDLFSMRLRQGDTMLICSDGLSNLVGEPEIVSCLLLDNLQGAARMLVGRALEGGGSDNITAVLVRISQQPPRTPLQEGAVEVSPQANGIFGRLKRMIF
jgi:serine/threonine protein phosphatase PrpC